MKRILLMILALLVITSTYSQTNKSTEKSTEKPGEKEKEISGDQVYKEITLEDFETTNFTEKDIQYRVAKEQRASVLVRDQYPAPIKDSKKYLGLKLYGRKGDFLNLIPPKKLIIDKFCKTISIWVYGKMFAGELSLLLKDADENVHRLIIGKLDFLGWRKLSVKITSEIAQQDKYLSQKRQIEIIKIIYSPGNIGRLPIWHYFYIDDITALVREKYTDRQDDNW
jgi:hypothetical protein